MQMKWPISVQPHTQCAALHKMFLFVNKYIRQSYYLFQG